MKKKQSDAVVGIVIFTAFIVLLAGIIWLKKISLTSTMATYTALFPKIGGLKVGDPVRVNGVEEGTVADIYLHESQVAVRFKITDTIPFTDSAEVRVINVGLMGERAVELTLSQVGTAHVPYDKKVPVVYIPGEYDPGISEAIGLLGVVMGEADGLIDTARYVITATVASPQFIQFFGDAVERLDSITLSMDRIIITNEKKLDGIFTDLKSVTSGVDNLVDHNSKAFSTIVQNTETLTGDAQTIATEADSLLESLRNVVAKVDTGNGTVGRLLNDSTLSEEIQTTLVKLDNLITEADTKGLKLRIKLGFRDKKKVEEAVE